MTDQDKAVALTEKLYEVIVQWDEGGGKRSRRELARRITAMLTDHESQIRADERKRLAEASGVKIEFGRYSNEDGEWHDYLSVSASEAREAIASLQTKVEQLNAELDKAQAEINCAEEVLDAAVCGVDAEKTDFDCIGDYVQEVCDGYKRRLEQSEQRVRELEKALNEALNQLETVQLCRKERWSNERINMVSAAICMGKAAMNKENNHDQA